MSIYKIYIKQTWTLIRRERSLSSVYIIGTGLAASMVMASAVVYRTRTTNITSEVHWGWMCYFSNVTYKLNGTKSDHKATRGPRLIREVIGNLRVPEDMAVIANSFMMPLLYDDAFMRLPDGDRSPKVRSKGCDDGSWRVYRLDFVEGRPFTKVKFLSGMPHAVLYRSLAGRLFRYEAAAEQTILLNDLGYTVGGVVDGVSGITADVYAEAWATYSSLSVAVDYILGERDEAIDLLETDILSTDVSDLPVLSEELRREVRRYNSGLSEGQVICEESLSYTDNLLSGLFGPETYIVLGMAFLLLLLVPALNLSGMNVSRIQECVGELGIRKAFGATKATLMGQVFVESMALMSPGDVVGLLFFYVLVLIFRNALLVLGFNLLGTNGDIFFSPGILLNMSVFACAFGVCIALDLLSSMLLAWRIVRGNITNASNG